MSLAAGDMVVSQGSRPWPLPLARHLAAAAATPGWAQGIMPFAKNNNQWGINNSLPAVQGWLLCGENIIYSSEHEPAVILQVHLTLLHKQGPPWQSSGSSAGDTGLMSCRGTKIPRVSGQLSPRTTTTEPTNDRAYELWTPSVTTKIPHLAPTT